MTSLQKWITFLSGVLLAPSLLGLHVKIVSVDHHTGRIEVLLPMHNTRLEASLVREESEIRVRPNEFYEAELEAGEVQTTKPNLLRIKIPEQRPTRFRLRKITFLER